ncbi:MAG: hypothetical protein JJE52_02250 [Acidimicrobiia bacterium]|nr:hypothetical protein [Acidimicrobiia bacterium]
MAGSNVHSADDLETMSPNERDALIREGIITEPDSMPADLVGRARERMASRVAARDAGALGI